MNECMIHDDGGLAYTDMENSIKVGLTIKFFINDSLFKILFSHIIYGKKS